jgi:hypothetical protein
MSDTQTTKIAAFLDNVGRTIVGQLESEDENTLNIVNPVVLSTVPTPDNRMSIQLFPLVFREFLGDKEADVKFSFNKNSITVTDISALDYRLQAQYNQIFNKSNIFVPNQEQIQATTDGNSPNVVKLFEE